MAEREREAFVRYLIEDGEEEAKFILCPWCGCKWWLDVEEPVCRDCTLGTE